METADLEELRKIIDTKIIYLVSGDFGCTDCDYTSKFRHNLPKQNTKKYTNLCFYIKNYSASMVFIGEFSSNNSNHCLARDWNFYERWPKFPIRWPKPKFCIDLLTPQSKGIGIMAGCDVGRHSGKGGGRGNEAEEGGGRIGEGGVKDG